MTKTHATAFCRDVTNGVASDATTLVKISETAIDRPALVGIQTAGATG
jgi:hypothetical protein